MVPISTATNKAGKAIKVAGGQFSDIAITPNGKTLYVTGPGNGVRGTR